MKPMTITRHKFSGELYKFVREYSGTNSILKYYFTKTVKLTAGLDAANRMTIRCNEPLTIGFVISNIKDSNGNLILSNTNWQITSIQPVLNAFNSIEGYTMKATKYQGEL